MNCFQAALSNNTIEVLNYLRDGNVNICDSNGAALLHYAARGNAMEVANILIHNYININICDSNGETAIFEVVRTAKLGFIKLLLRYHANINIVNNFGESLLFRAIIKGNQDVIDLLLENGNYDFDLKNNNGENILNYAIKVRNNQLFFKYAELEPKLLENINYNGANLLMEAIRYQNSEVVDYLLKTDFNPYYNDKELNNIFFYGAKYGNYEIIKSLLTLKPILLGKNKEKQSILDLVKENLNSVENLFDNYLNSSDYKFYLKTYPFHAAVVARNYDLLEVCPIDIKKRDMFDISLLDYIKMVNDLNIFKIFKLT